MLHKKTRNGSDELPQFVRVPYADQGLNKIPDSVTDEQALLVGDVLATGFWAARISEITEEAYHLFENKLDGVIKVAVAP